MELFHILFWKFHDDNCNCFPVILVIKLQTKLETQAVTRNSAVAERPRALRVTEYFAKSLKVIRNDTIEQGVCKYLLAFHWKFETMSVSRTVSEIG